MSVYCWLPGNDLKYSSFNGNLNLNSSQKNFTVKRIADSNSNNTFNKMLVRNKNISVFRSDFNSFTIKTVAQSPDGEIVPIAALCDMDSTASDQEQAEDTAKAIRQFTNQLGLTLLVNNSLDGSIKSAFKFFGLDLFGLRQILRSIDTTNFNVNILTSYLDGLDGGGISMLKNSLKVMGSGSNGQIYVISAAAREAIFNLSSALQILSTIGGAVAVAKLASTIVKWMAKQQELYAFDKASNRAKNAKRIAYAKEMVGYLNNLSKDQKQLPENVQKDLIEFFSDAEYDGKELYEMTNDLANIAKNKTFIDRLKLSLGIR